MTRTVSARYQDPLDRVWLACAERMGLRVVRSSDAYASSDGSGTLVLGTTETLDADDCVAQMVFHELCHALIQGEQSLRVRDWGLDNRTDRDEPRERACLRLQAQVAGEYGLRGFLAPTTDHRSFFDGLGSAPLAEAPPQERDWVLAALERLERPPFAPHVRDALRVTSQIVTLARQFRNRGDPTLYDLDSPSKE